MGPIAHFGETKQLQKATESLQGHLSETEIPIGETKLIRVSSNVYVKGTWWRRIDQISEAEFDFLGFGNMWK